MALGESFDAVLAAAKRGDESALAALYEDLAPSVLGYLRGQGAAEPEDLASEVFVGLVRGLARFRGEEPDLRSWVFTIAHRRLTDERRRRARRVIDLVEPRRLPEIVAGDAEAEAVERLGDGPGMRALRGLTEDQRTVVLLRVVADLSVAEVARITDKAEGAVKALQRRAVAAMIRTFSPEGVSSPTP
jgi:RNA polymerase sigma-70 factor (ECF subfamily)